MWMVFVTTQKINKHIEIVRSTISELSSMGQESCDGLVIALAKHYTTVGVTIINTSKDLAALVARKPDLVFLGMKYVPEPSLLGLNEPIKVWLAEYLDQHGIAYTGSGHKAHKLELNKSLAKQRVLNLGLKTSEFYVVKHNQTTTALANTLAFPVFIKPTDKGGGRGIDSYSVATTVAQLQAKVLSIASSLRADSLVERYLPGREFSVAILKEEDSSEFSVMPIELTTDPDSQGSRLLSQHVKSSNIERVSAVTEKRLRAQLITLAMDVFMALGARDYGRIDIRLDEYGVPHFLEANLIPSLISGYGSFPKACVMNSQLNYEAMILRITALGLARSANVANDLLEDVIISNNIFASRTIALKPV